MPTNTRSQWRTVEGQIIQRGMMHPQAESPLFGKCSPEIRNSIFRWVLMAEEDKSTIFMECDHNPRPGDQYLMKPATVLLLTCSRAYVEAHRVIVNINEHTFWYGAIPPWGLLEPGLPSRKPRYSRDIRNYFDKMLTKQQASDATSIHLHVNQDFLEHRNTGGTTNYCNSFAQLSKVPLMKRIKHLRITIGVLDWGIDDYYGLNNLGAFPAAAFHWQFAQVTQQMTLILNNAHNAIQHAFIPAPAAPLNGGMVIFHNPNPFHVFPVAAPAPPPAPTHTVPVNPGPGNGSAAPAPPPAPAHIVAVNPPVNAPAAPPRPRIVQRPLALDLRVTGQVDLHRMEGLIQNRGQVAVEDQSFASNLLNLTSLETLTIEFDFLSAARPSLEKVVNHARTWVFPRKPKGTGKSRIEEEMRVCGATEVEEWDATSPRQKSKWGELVSLLDVDLADKATTMKLKWVVTPKAVARA